METTKNRRRKFLVNKPLQFRYMTYISLTLFVVSAVIIGSLYFGIWGGILDAFSDQKIQEQLLTASRLTEYENARRPTQSQYSSVLNLFKQSEKLSHRQREVFKDILDETNKKLIQKVILLFILLAWGSIYLSHKIAGPLYRFHAGLEAIDQGKMQTRFHLRKFDEMQLLAAKLNETVENLDHLFARLKTTVRDDAKNPNQLIIKLHEELDKIKTTLDA